MIHFQFTTKEILTIRIVEEFSHSDTERIALFLESSYDLNLDMEIIFQVESDLPKDQMELLGNFCRRLPYKSQIDLKYFLPVW